MKTSLDFLPERKQRELNRIVDILHEEFAARIAGATSQKRKRGKILKIILFGSHARGDWVEDPKGGYYSDFDLLVIVNHHNFTDYPAWWSAAEDRILRDSKIRTVPQLIIHTLEEVNGALAEGRYFFSDLVRDGVILYELHESGPRGEARHKLGRPVPPDPKAAFEQAERYFDQWIGNARDSIAMYRKGMEIRKLRKAAFELHQATESAYSAFLLTITNYLPKDHNIRRLRSRAEDIEPSLRNAWPRGQKPFDRRFELLRRAYVEARYSEHYEIQMGDLEWLETRILCLIERVEAACRAKLASLKLQQ